MVQRRVAGLVGQLHALRVELTPVVRVARQYTRYHNIDKKKTRGGLCSTIMLLIKKCILNV